MKQHVIELDAIWTPPVQQKVFRALLRSFSYPGAVQNLSEVLAGRTATLGVLATLLDNTTTFCDLHDQVTKADLAMLECILVEAEEAGYLLCDGAKSPSQVKPRIGDIYRPELGATIVLRGANVGEGDLLLRVKGPGVRNELEIALAGFDASWFVRRSDCVADYPTGVDFLLCDRTSVVALPRTTNVEVVCGKIDSSR